MMVQSAAMSSPPRAAATWAALVLIPVALLLSGCEDATSPPEFLAPFEGDNSTNSTNSTSAGWCTEADKRRMDEMGYGNDDGSLGAEVYQCARSNVNWLFKVNEGKMKDCLVNVVGFSAGCAACFGRLNMEGSRHCKTECLGSWCSRSCQECNLAHVSPSWMEQCTGYDLPQPPHC